MSRNRDRGPAPGMELASRSPPDRLANADRRATDMSDSTLLFKLADEAARTRKAHEAERRLYDAVRVAHRAFQQDGIKAVDGLHEAVSSYERFLHSLQLVRETEPST